MNQKKVCEDQQTGECVDETTEHESNTWLGQLIEPFFFRMRYISFIAVFASLVSALIMFFLGLVEMFSVTRDLFAHPFSEDIVGNSTVGIIHSLDSFLFGLVLLIFSYGIYDLFIREIPQRRMDCSWLLFKDVSDLKHTLVEIIIIILIIDFFVLITRQFEHYIQTAWEFLLIPAGVFLLALGMRLIHYDEEES